jgi:hypothetical protein
MTANVLTGVIDTVDMYTEIFRVGFPTRVLTMAETDTGNGTNDATPCTWAEVLAGGSNYQKWAWDPARDCFVSAVTTAGSARRLLASFGHSDAVITVPGTETSFRKTITYDHTNHWFISGHPTPQNEGFSILTAGTLISSEPATWAVPLDGAAQVAQQEVDHDGSLYVRLPPNELAIWHNRHLMAGVDFQNMLWNIAGIRDNWKQQLDGAVVFIRFINAKRYVMVANTDECHAVDSSRTGIWTNEAAKWCLKLDPDNKSTGFFQIQTSDRQNMLDKDLAVVEIETGVNDGEYLFDFPAMADPGYLGRNAFTWTVSTVLPENGVVNHLNHIVRNTGVALLDLKLTPAGGITDDSEIELIILELSPFTNALIRVLKNQRSCLPSADGTDQTALMAEICSEMVPILGATENEETGFPEEPPPPPPTQFTVAFWVCLIVGLILAIIFLWGWIINRSRAKRAEDIVNRHAAPPPSYPPMRYRRFGGAGEDISESSDKTPISA